MLEVIISDQQLKAYVEKADAGSVLVCVLDASIIDELKGLGFIRGNADVGYRLPVADDRAKAKAFAGLRQLGVAFSAGREWCPAEVFEHLREQGLLHGAYLRQAWTGPGKMQLSMA